MSGVDGDTSLPPPRRKRGKRQMRNSKPALPNHFQKVEKVIPVFSVNLKPGANDPENITVCPIMADHTVSLTDA
eukprot:scaffold20655_cov28-Attheya_sp.AAC.2